MALLIPDVHPPLLEPLLHEMAAQGDVRQFPAHKLLIREGDDGDALFILLSGRVKVYSSHANGKEVVLRTHGPGEYFGELALDGGRRSVSVMALEPTACVVVSGARLLEFIVRHPDFATYLIRDLMGRVRALTSSVKRLALEDVYGRVVALLDELCDPAEPDGTRVLRERLTQQDIADRVGSSREMVSRIFKALNTGGYIAQRSGRISVLKKPPAGW